jgi:peptide/nickel transport system substrate-binding protein
MKRRDFLRWSGLAGLGLASGLLYACSPAAPAAPAAPTAAPKTAVAPTAAPAPAATAAPAAAAARPSGTLTIAQGADVTSLDPQQTQASAPRGIMRSMFDSLYTVDQNLKLQPALAKSYTLVDPKTWEFKLRDDVVFHNGEKFTTESVKFSVDRFVDPKTKNIYANTLDPVEKVDIVDDYTVRITTKVPYPSLLENLGIYLFLAPPKALTDMGDEYFKKPVGSGPYRFVEWVPGERLTVQAVDYKHWSGGPWVDKLVWRTITEPATRVTALRTGEADLIANVPPNQVSAIQGDGMKLMQNSGLGIMVLILNAGRGPTADPRVRQAMNYAIDKDKIIKGLFAGTAKPLNSPYNSFQEGYDASAPPPYPYNPDKAKQLLAEAGQGGGFALTIDTPSGRYLNDKQVAEAAAGDLHKVGIEMNVNPLEWGAMVKSLQEKQSDAFLLMQNNKDTNIIVNTCFHSKTKGIPWLGYANPEVDTGIEQASQQVDEQQRVAMYTKLGKQITEDAPWVFLHQQDDLYGVRDRVQNWKPVGDQIIYVNGVTVKA